MAEKKFQGSPFGTQTARFDVSAVHPKSKLPGTYTQIPYCKKLTTPTNTMLGPGRYDVDVGGFSDKAVGERSAGPGWARSYEVSRMAALPHLLHKEQWELKRMLKRKLGPGSYEIKDFLEAADDKPKSTRGIIQTKEQRFKEKVQSKTPGPGTYGKGGIPHAAVEIKDKKSASTVGLLDAGSSSRNLPMVGSHLGPGSYNFESFVEQTSKKLTSLRGPYDLFSGDRNKSMKTGHYATTNQGNLGPGQYEIKSFLDEQNTEHKTRHGRFGKVTQHPDQPTERIYSFTLSQNPRELADPGPGTFNPSDPNVKPPAQAKKSPGFLSSAMRNDKMATKFFTGNFNPVGPGRYDIQKWEDAQHKNGQNSSFKSKTDRPDHARAKFLQERIRGKDLRPQDRVFIVGPEQPNQHLVRTKTHMSTAATTQHIAAPQRALTVV